MVAPLHMVVVEEASTNSNERLDFSVEKGDPLLGACWSHLGWVCILHGMAGHRVRLRCDEGRTGGLRGGLGVLGVGK